MKRLAVFFIIIFSLFFVGNNKAHADDTQLHCLSVETSGNFSCRFDENGIYVHQYWVYQGQYPDTSILIQHVVQSFDIYPLPAFGFYPAGVATHEFWPADVWWKFDVGQTMDTQFDYLNIPANMSSIISPTQPTGSSTVDYNVNFTGVYTNTTDYTQICLFLTTTDSSIAPHCVPIPLINGVDLPYSFSYMLSPNHSYTYHIELYDGNGGYSSPSSDITFNTTALQNLTTPAWAAETCDWTSPSTWTGCFNNLVHGLFYPSSESVNQFSNLYNNFKNKPPFGYVTAVISQLKNVNDTNTSVFSLQSLPILNTMIFNPMRLGIVWLLWVGFAFVIYHRLKNIQL